MANKKIKGITIEIGGSTQKLDQALKSSESRSKELSTELGQINKQLRFDTSNIDLWKQKQTVLTEQVENTSSQLEILKQAEQQAQAQFEKGDISADQYRALQREVIATENSLKSYQKQLYNTNSKIGELDGSIASVKRPLDALNDTIGKQEQELTGLRDEYANVVLSQGKSSTEAKELASRISSLNNELKENKDKLNSAETEAKQLASALDDTGDSAEGAEGGFTIMKGALADLTADAIRGAVSAVGDFISALFDLSEATEEYRRMQAKLSGSSESFGYSTDFAREKFQQFYSYLGDDQASTNAISNMLGMQVETETLSKLADGAIAVWTAYGDSIPIESLTESINETSQVAKITGTLADALNWAGISEDEFNAKLETMATTQERADFIAQTLNDTYGTSKQKYDELAGSVIEANDAEARLKDTQAQLGEAMAPINTAFTDLKQKALEVVLPLVENLADAFMELYDWMSENPEAMTVLTGVVAGLATAFTVLAGALAIQALIQGVTKAMSALNIVFSLNPIVLVVSAIAGLVVAFGTLWATSDTFRQFWIDLWASIKQLVGEAVQGIVDFFTITIPETWNNFISYMTQFGESVKQIFSDMWNGIIAFFTETIPAWIDEVIQWFSELPYNLGVFVGEILKFFADWAQRLIEFYTKDVPEFIGKVVEWFMGLPQKIWNAIISAVQKVSEWGTQIYNTASSKVNQTINGIYTWFSELPQKIWNAIIGAVDEIVKWGNEMLATAEKACGEVFDGIVNSFSNIKEKMKEIGSNIVYGIWDGIQSMAGWLGDMVSDFIDGIMSVFRTETDSHSPSRRSKREVGIPVAQGVGVGIEESQDEVNRQAEELVDGMYDTIDGVQVERAVSSKLSIDGLNMNLAGANQMLYSKMNQLIDIVSEYLPNISENMNTQIFLNDGTLVGALTPSIDAELGNLSALKRRGG